MSIKYWSQHFQCALWTALIFSSIAKMLFSTYQSNSP